jgi:hypothetical protein
MQAGSLRYFFQPTIPPAKKAALFRVAALI